VNELSGEKIDVIPWDADAATFVASALSPAQVQRVDIDEPEKTAVVIVPERQLSLAIGREGQNARLAARLTGWRIDIKSDVAVARAELEAWSAGGVLGEDRETPPATADAENADTIAVDEQPSPVSELVTGDTEVVKEDPTADAAPAALSPEGSSGDEIAAQETLLERP
jgi:transcription termination/antitermination protein NusA